jgi:hypothetical protein
VVSGGNIDANVLAGLLADVRMSPPRKPRRRAKEAAAVAAPQAPNSEACATAPPAVSNPPRLVATGHGRRKSSTSVNTNVPFRHPEECV